MIKFYWNEYEFSVIQYGKGIYRKDMAGHSHSANSYELHYIAGGCGTLFANGKTYNVSKGDFFITGPNVYHKQNTDKANPLEEIHIYLQGSGKKTNNALADAFLSKSFYFCRNDDFEIYFSKIIAEKDGKAIGYESIVAGYIQILLTEIARQYIPNDIKIPINNGNLNDKRFLLIENAFIEHPNDLTITKLSEIIGLCERQTQRLLKQYYGKTFTEKIAESVNVNS